MDASEDPRDKNMWMKKVIVTSEEIVTYATNFPPIGVYIPKGRIKVPHRRSKVSPHTRHTTKGRSNNLLMIKQSSLPPIDVYRNCDVINERNPSCQVANASQNCKKESFSELSQSVAAPQYFPKYYEANNVMQFSESMFASSDSTPVMPPPYVETAPANRNPYHSDFKTIMPSERTYPTNRQYYQHLSAIAAMAWSDCNQATLKLKRIYEETAQLSRAIDPLGGIPTMQLPEYPGIPTNECAALPGVPNQTLHRRAIVARRHLADGTKRYLDHSMSQSGLVNGNLDCRRKVLSNPSSFVEHCQRPINNPMHCDIAPTNNPLNYNAYGTRTGGGKRKQCATLPLHPPKVPRLAQPVPAYTVPYDDVKMPHFFNNNAPIIPSRNLDSLPPSYESIQSSYNLFPGIFPNQRPHPTSNFRVMPTKVESDVGVASSYFCDVLSLPSVSFSPTQPRIGTPFVV